MKQSRSRRRSGYCGQPHRYSDLFERWARACRENPSSASALAAEHTYQCLGGRLERLTPFMARELHWTNMAAVGRVRRDR